MGLSLEEANKHNPLQNDDLSVPKFLVDCINIIEQGKDLLSHINFFLYLSILIIE